MRLKSLDFPLQESSTDTREAERVSADQFTVPRAGKLPKPLRPPYDPDYKIDVNIAF
jgi:hypothetical protein